MKTFFWAILLLFVPFGYAQNDRSAITRPEMTDAFLQLVKLEDPHGHLITNLQQKKELLAKKQQYIDSLKKIGGRNAMLTAVPLCSNGAFEQYNGSNKLLDFAYTVGDLLNPMECRDLDDPATTDIPEYVPSSGSLMCTTVPANHLDQYIGDIEAFDQYALKINYTDSHVTVSKIQGKRFKTDNETQLKFNYKAVLQSIAESGHDNEQPFFKARVLNQSGNVVDEFCLIGNPANCIFKEAPGLAGDAIVLYTPNWQSGILDISSIPNNQEFTIEFVAARCGLGGHFGYAYIDDICLLHSDENLQGSITLDPLYKICPALPLQVCGSFTIPNSGGVFASVNSVTLEVRNQTNAVVYTSQVPVQLDLATKRFCFEIQAANLPDVAAMGYNVSVTINYGLLQTECTGTNFNTATDDDANPGYDIWFLNCTNCPIDLHTDELLLCDSDHNGTETFNLQTLNSLVVNTVAGLTFTYYNTIADAVAATNPIAAINAYTTSSRTIFVRASSSDTCFKIIPANLVVKNPAAYISGVLNVCSGSTVLTASAGASYLWGNGATTQSITASAIGSYSVTVTDAFGCSAVGSVNIPNSTVAAQPDIEITQPTCFIDTGTITVTSPATQYSFDNGATWVTNSSVSNMVVGSYTIQIKTIMGCTSYPTTVSVVPFLATRPDFTTTQPQFCGDLGSITITSAAPWYSFDDGLTWVTTNSMSNLPSGVYNVRTKDDFDCVSNYSSVLLNGEFLDYCTYTSLNPFCGNLGSITVTTPASAYSFDGGTVWQSSPTLGGLTSGSYLVKIRDAMGCTSPNNYIYLTDLEDTYPEYTVVDAGCDTYGSVTITTIGDFYSFDGGTTWSASPTYGNLAAPQNFSIRVKKGSCLSRTNSVYFYSTYHALPQTSNYEAFVCDHANDGQQITDLSDYNSFIVSNLTGMSFTYFRTQAGATSNLYTDQIQNFTSYNIPAAIDEAFVRVTDSFGCINTAKITLYLIDTPVIVLESDYPLCVGKSITVDAGGGVDAYLWSNGDTTQVTTITQPGTYWVQTTKDHVTASGPLSCSTTRSFNVFLSDKAKILSVDTRDWTNNENTIMIYAEGIGDYEYSLDGIEYQDSPFFTNLPNGAYTAYVHDKFECGTVDEEVFLLMYPKYFTPNEDTFNDFWKIKLSENEPGLHIEIFSRDGKLLKVLKNDEGWDGNYHREKMPTSDYWFVVTRGNGHQHRGHFTLKR